MGRYALPALRRMAVAARQRLDAACRCRHALGRRSNAGRFQRLHPRDGTGRTHYDGSTESARSGCRRTTRGRGGSLGPQGRRAGGAEQPFANARNSQQRSRTGREAEPAAQHAHLDGAGKAHPAAEQGAARSRRGTQAARLRTERRTLRTPAHRPRRVVTGQGGLGAGRETTRAEHRAADTGFALPHRAGRTDGR